MNAGIQETTLVEKVLAGQRISAEEALELYHLPLQELGALADHRRTMAKMDAYDQRGNEIVTYIVERNINYTNVCNVYCKFCAFYRTERDSDHYVLSHEQIDQKIDEAVLALLLLGRHDEMRVWKGHDWHALERLHQKGYISNPASRAKSVVLTDDGLREAERLFKRLFTR